MKQAHLIWMAMLLKLSWCIPLGAYLHHNQMPCITIVTFVLHKALSREVQWLAHQCHSDYVLIYNTLLVKHGIKTAIC